MYEDFMLRLARLTEITKSIEKRAPLIVAEHRAKLEERLSEVLGQADFDPARILTEAAIFADRCNVTEELVRLAVICQLFRLPYRKQVLWDVNWIF